MSQEKEEMIKQESIQQEENLQEANYEEKGTKTKKNYSKINRNQRTSIISEILTEKKTINEVAQEYNLLPSTCKSIVNTYLKEGRIGKKERRIRKLKKISTVYNIVINPLNPLDSTVTQTSSVQDIIEPSIKSKKAKKEEQDPKDYEQDIQAKTMQYLQNWLQLYELQYKAIQQLQSLGLSSKNGILPNLPGK